MASELRPKIRMKDIGETWALGPAKVAEDRVHYPSITVDAKDFPHLSALEVGKEHHVRARVVKKGHHIDGEGKHRMEIEIRSMGEEKKSPREKSKLEENGY